MNDTTGALLLSIALNILFIGLIIFDLFMWKVIKKLHREHVEFLRQHNRAIFRELEYAQKKFQVMEEKYIKLYNSIDHVRSLDDIMKEYKKG
jgi:hypothetical protein